jgi:HK97 family phage portal protein
MGILDLLRGWKPGDGITQLDIPVSSVKSVQWWPDLGSQWARGNLGVSTLRSTRSKLSYADVDAMFSSAFMACLSTITRAVPQAPLEVRRVLADGTQEPVQGHPLPELFNRPNPYHTSTQMWMALLTNYYVSGDGYQQIARDGMKAPAELYSRPYWTMTPRGSRDGTRLIDHYDYTQNGRLTEVPLGDVLHYRCGIDERSPSDGRCGVSPIESVMGEIFTDEEAASLVSSVMSNTGTMTLYTPKGDVQVDDPTAEAFEAKVQAATTGERRGRAILAQVEMDAKRIGLTPEELDYKSVRRIVEERVAAVMCVPAVRAGLGAGLDHSTLANFEEAGAALWEDCLVPLLRDVADVLTAFLLPQYGPAKGLRVAFAFEKVPALNESEDAKAARAKEALLSGGITRNEYRAEVGRESEGPTGDVYYIPNTVTVVPWQTPPEALQPAPQQVSALEQMAQQKALQTGMVAGYLKAKTDEATPTLAEYEEVRRVLGQFEIDGLDEYLKPKGDR